MRYDNANTGGNRRQSISRGLEEISTSEDSEFMWYKPERTDVEIWNDRREESERCSI